MTPLSHVSALLGWDNPPTQQPNGPEGRPIDVVTVVLVGLEDSLSEELAGEEGFDVQRSGDIEGLDQHRGADAVLIALEGAGPLEVLGALRARAPEAAVLVVTDPDREADGAVALHGGAEDHLVRGSIPDGFLSRAIRYAIAQRRLRRELSTSDEITGLPNLRGFAPIAEHHLRMADRAKTQVVFVFMRLDGLQAARAAGPEEAEVLVREAANVLLEAVRDADVPARITEDTFAVLLTGDAVGAETLVLSRLVEAIAVHDADRQAPRSLSLSVGSALYDPDEPATLSQILETAGRRLGDQRPEGSSKA